MNPNAERLRRIQVSDFEKNIEGPGGTGLEEEFRNFMLREIAIQLTLIAEHLVELGVK